jgi:hypothetical protein
MGHVSVADTDPLDLTVAASTLGVNVSVIVRRVVSGSGAPRRGPCAAPPDRDGRAGSPAAPRSRAPRRQQDGGVVSGNRHGREDVETTEHGASVAKQ